MAIILRENTGTNTGKGEELSYLDMDTNLESFYYSSSLSGETLVLHTTGSETHSIDLSVIAAAGSQGVQGITGAQGIQGITGAQGTEGTGTQGVQGITGLQGIQGIAGGGGEGSQGVQGIQGTEGSGIQGIQGITGAQGTEGTGTQGVQGIQGPAGGGGEGEGSQGVQGIQGITGAQGTEGTGTQGVQGITGAQGIQGVQGASGGDTSGTAYSVMYRDSSGDTTSGTTNLTYDTSFDELTITTPSTSQPQLVLKTGGLVSAGTMLGFIQSRNINYVNGGQGQTPGIRFVGDGAWTNNVTYPSRIEFLTAQTNTAAVKAILNKTGDLWVANDVSASGELYAGGTTISNEHNQYPLVINPGTGRIFYSTSGSVGNNLTRTVNGSDPLILNATSTPALPDLNGGHLIYMPQDADQSIRFGWAAGDWGGSSWNRDFYCTVVNTGTNGNTDNDWEMGISIVTPNDGGGNFTVFTHGHQPGGTRRFQHNTVAANSGLTLPYDLQGGGVLNVYMDYASRIIVFNSAEFA